MAWVAGLGCAAASDRCHAVSVFLASAADVGLVAAGRLVLVRPVVDDVVILRSEGAFQAVGRAL